jgi:hypothetical protein
MLRDFLLRSPVFRLRAPVRGFRRAGCRKFYGAEKIWIPVRAYAGAQIRAALFIPWIFILIRTFGSGTGFPTAWEMLLRGLRFTVR